MKRKNIHKNAYKWCIYTFLALTLAVFALSQSVFSADEAYSWYCKRNKEHKQPGIDENVKFIEKNDGYYVDKRHGDNDTDKVVYLTFDAGYENGNVEKILDVLKEENVPGAFFILGHLVEKNTDLVERIANEGHLVCNHTMHHYDMSRITSKRDFERELMALEKIYTEKTGKALSRYYRPPEGRFSERSIEYARSLGYKTVFWSIAYADWDNGNQMSEEKAKEKILTNLHNGAVILLHPTSETNARIMRDLITEIREKGYRFGTLDELTT